MPTIKDIKPFVLALPAKEKEKLLIKLLRKDPEEINRIYYKEIANAEEFHELINELQEEIVAIIVDAESRRGILQKNLAKGISKASQTIKKYQKLLGPEKEAELYLSLLEILFQDFRHEFGTCWTIFDCKVAQILSKVITLVSKKTHEDYQIEFEDKVNTCLKDIKTLASHIDFVYNMPDKLTY